MAAERFFDLVLVFGAGVLLLLGTAVVVSVLIVLVMNVTDHVERHDEAEQVRDDDEAGVWQERVDAARRAT